MIRTVWLVGPLLCGALAAGAAWAAQAPAAIEVTPIDCWWRTSKSAVMVGERFTVTLTCSVYETDRDKVVVEPNQLDAAALALAPFEVVSGRRHDDLVVRPFRHFQYEFIVRIVGNAAFGQDVDIPALSIRYATHSTLAGSGGREQTYVLPALPVRVLSLVPARAGTIRDSTHEAFRELEGRRRRASAELMASAVAFAFALVLLALAVVGLVRRQRARAPARERLLAPSTTAGACLGELRRLAAEVARDGWTLDRTARALAALRVTAAVALGDTVAQARVDRTTPPREGQVPLRTGITRARRAVISAAASARAIEQRLAAGEGRRSRLDTTALEPLRESLGVFTRARYGPDGALDTAALDQALAAGLQAARRVWVSRLVLLWPARSRAVTRTAPTPGAAAWTR
jgi:hypothetical protein